MSQTEDRYRSDSWFPLPDGHLLKALWILCCTLIMSWGAWAAVGTDWFAGATLVMRVVLAAIFFALAVGMARQALSEWKTYRTRRTGPDIERIDSPR